MVATVVMEKIERGGTVGTVKFPCSAFRHGKKRKKEEGKELKETKEEREKE